MFTRQNIEKEEELRLACFAMKCRYTRGRRYKEDEHSYRSAYQRDRDRIIHSTAFRKLEYKTQVFVNHEGDYYRTRLTHTLEVAQIAKSIARTLRLNEDLVEAVALAHDLGHTPFGHAGEEVLHNIMKEHGGFDHNLQGLRVVDSLEKRYPDFKGLNLTWEVREGIVKHSTQNRLNQIDELEPDKSPILETQVVDIADEIAYDNHDLDDGLTSGLIEEEELKKIEFWQEVDKKINSRYPRLDAEIKKYQIIKLLINLQITNLITESEKKLKEFNIASYQQVREEKERFILFSPEMLKKRQSLREFLFKNLYQHYRVIRMSNKACRFLQDLFSVYLAKPEQLPPSSQRKIKEDGVYRTICDYIAGMTDRYALEEYNKLFDPYTKV